MDRRSTRKKKLSRTAIQNKKQEEQIRRNQEIRKEKTNTRRRKKRELAIQARRMAVNNPYTAKQIAKYTVHASNPERKTGLSHVDAVRAFGTWDAAANRSQAHVPDPPLQLVYAIQLANTVMSNKLLLSNTQDVVISRLRKVSKRLLDYTTYAPGEDSGMRWTGGGSVPQNWKDWLCGESPIKNHEAEHVIPQFEMTSHYGIFSRTTGIDFAGMSITKATDFITSLQNPTELTNQDNIAKLLRVTLLIGEMFPSDRCFNQKKSDIIFYKIQESGQYVPFQENIVNVLGDIWDAVAEKSSFHDCADSVYQDKLSKYQIEEGRDIFIKERLAFITDVVQDICDVINDQRLTKGISPVLSRLAASASGAMTQPGELTRLTSPSAPVPPSSPVYTASTAPPSAPPVLRPQISDIVPHSDTEQKAADILASFHQPSIWSGGKKTRKKGKKRKNIKIRKQKKNVQKNIKIKKQSQKRTRKTRKMNRKK